MNTSRIAVATALFGAATAVAVGCGSSSSSSLPPCQPGETLQCSCPDGTSSIQQCVGPNQWAACQCGGSGLGGTTGAVGGGTGVGGDAMGLGGGGVGLGGTPVVGQGGTPTGSGGASTGCSAEANYPNLVNVDGWIGCDATVSTDNPSGLQGAFYLYGDDIACTPASGNPCATGECCLDGATIVDNVDYLAWGCGIGLELNSDGGDPSVKSPYAGTASCFDITLTGTSGGNAVRIGFTQMVPSEVAPFVEVPAVTGSITHTVCFTDVACPAWGIEQGTCSETGQNYELQVQVVGAERESTFSLCLSSLIAN